MMVIPAIDLLGGKAVRLRLGRREEATVYRDVPWELCAEWAEAGVERIHVVDLDGAFAGARAQRDAIERILAESPVPVQVGGGLRDAEAVRTVLGAGAGFAVLGTMAARAPAEAGALCGEFPGRIVIAVDAAGGRVAVDGWTEETELSAEELARSAAGWGAAAVLYTDVTRDGTEVGPNVAATAALQRAIGETPVIASGGVGSLEHLRALAGAGIAMAVVGRALYEGRFSLAEAIRAC